MNGTNTYRFVWDDICVGWFPRALGSLLAGVHAQVSLNLCRLIRIHLDRPGLIWMYLESPGLIWIDVDSGTQIHSRGFNVIQLNLCGFSSQCLISISPCFRLPVAQTRCTVSVSGMCLWRWVCVCVFLEFYWHSYRGQALLSFWENWRRSLEVD